MDKRGQILSLDYVISLMLVLLALGLLLNFFELQTVNAKEAQLNSELEALANGAARLALTSPDIACRLTSITGDPPKDIGVLPNCIPKNGRLTKQNLGIQGFECAIATDPIDLLSTECNTDFPDGTDYYSVTRKIVVSDDTTITKDKLEECIRGELLNCVLSDANLTISIWRTPT